MAVTNGNRPQKPRLEHGTEGTVTVRQTGSPLRRPAEQRATLKGLGLNKVNRTRTLQDTPAVRGMIARVSHMVEIVPAGGEERT